MYEKYWFLAFLVVWTALSILFYPRSPKLETTQEIKHKHPRRRMSKKQKASAEERMTAYRVMQIAQTRH